MRDALAFLSIERSLGNIGYGALNRELTSVRRGLIATAREDATSAIEATQNIDLRRVETKVEAAVPTYVRAAFLLGASLVHGSIAKTPAGALRRLPQDVIDATAHVHAKIVGEKCSEHITRAAANAIADHDAYVGEIEAILAVKWDRIRKADDLADRLNAAVDGSARMMSGISANLTTSRLVSFGFLAEARVTGIAKYQLEAVLDDRTSKICRRLHGRVFDVEKSFEYVQTVLSTTDPEELKSLAPFVKGNKSALKNLESASDEELASMGVMVPPFHPGCRTILTLVSSEETTTQTFTPIDGDNMAQLSAQSASSMDADLSSDTGGAWGEDDWLLDEDNF